MAYPPMHVVREAYEKHRYQWMVGERKDHPAGFSGECLLDPILDQAYFLPLQRRIKEVDYYEAYL